MAESPVQGNLKKVRPGPSKEVPSSSSSSASSSPSSSSPEASLTWCLSHLCKPEDQREGTVDTDGGGEMDKRRKASQWRALVAIRTQHVKGGSTGIARFRTRGGPKLLLDLLKYPECPRKILDLALSILANCCTELETRIEVRKLGGITVVVDILKRNVAMETVQNRAARALGNLSMDPQSAALIHSAGGVPLLLLCVSLSSAPSSPTAAPNQAPCPKMECAQSAARALLYLADTPSNRLSLLVQGTLTALAPLIAPEYPQALRRAALKTLHELSRGCGLECAREVSRSGVLAQLGVMASGESGKPFEELALKTLANMCAQGCLRPFVGSLGVIQKFTEEVKRDPLKSGVFLKALCLCCKEAVNRAKVKESGGLEVLIGFLSAHQSHPLSRLAILACVDFVYDESALEQLQELGLVPLLVARLVELAKGEEPSAERMDVSVTSNMSASEVLPFSGYDSFDFPPPEGSRKEDGGKEQGLGSSSFLSLRSWLVSEGLISSEGELLDSPGGVEGELGSLQIPPSSSPLLPPSPNADTNSVTCPSPSHPLPSSTPKQVAPPAPVSSPAQPQLSPPRRTTAPSTSTPQTSSASTPQPSSAFTPHASASTPQTSSASTPQPSSAFTPHASASTPQTSSTSTPQPSSAFTPQPSSASTPQPSSTSTPQPSSASTPQPSSTSTPKPSASTPQTSSTFTPQPSSASTPPPSSTSTPKPFSTSTPKPFASTPQTSSTSTPQPSSASTPQPSSSTPVPQIQLNSPSYLSSPANLPQVPVSPSKFSSPQRKRPRVHPAARLTKITLDAPPSLPRAMPYYHPYHPEPWLPESPVLLLLSRFSHSTDPSTALVNQGVMSGLLFYLTQHRDPSGRCFRMLCRLSCNPNCLQALVRTGSVALIRQRLCQRGGGGPERGERQTDRVKAKVEQLGLALLNNLRVQSESWFGSGVLTHVMLSGSEVDKLNCALSLPLVNSNKALLKKLLLDSGGLLLALQPLGCDEDDNEDGHTSEFRRLLSDWFNSPQIVPAPQLYSLYFSLLIGCLSSLMGGFKTELAKSRLRTLSSVKTLSFDQASRSSPPPLKRPRLADLCPYSDSAFDLHFRLDDGTQVSANRDALAGVEGTDAAGSEYFRALLGSGFGEAQRSTGEAIAIKEVSKGMLLPVLHYLHGCRLTKDTADAKKHDGDGQVGGRCRLLESLALEGLHVRWGETGEHAAEGPAFQKTPLGEMMIGACRFLVTELQEEAEDLCVSLLLSCSTKTTGPPASALAEDKADHGGLEGESADECLAKRTSGLELSGVEAESVSGETEKRHAPGSGTPRQADVKKRPPASGPVRRASKAVHSTSDLKTTPVSRPSCVSMMDKSFHPEEARVTSKTSVKPGSRHGLDGTEATAPGGWALSSLLPQVYWFSQRYSYPGLGKACLSLLLGSQESPGAPRPPSSSAGDCLRRLAREADCLDTLRRDLLSLATLVLS